MNYYNVFANTYHNGELIGTQNAGCCLTEENKPAKEMHKITWENLDDKYQKLNFKCDFNYWGTKKGRRVSFFHCNAFNKNTWDVKEWKESLNIEVVVYNVKCEPTMKQLQIFDAVKVQKYLNERLGVQ